MPKNPKAIQKVQSDPGILLDCWRIFNSLKRRVSNKIFSIKRTFVNDYDIVFAAGSSAHEKYSRISKVLYINTHDNDKFLSLTNSETLIKGNYAVFHDEDFVSHPDLTVFGHKTIDSERYYTLINSFFSKIERQFNLEVIIAASPKSVYDINPFNNRKILYGKTAHLVKFCNLSLVVASVSVSFAVLYKKPIIFFSTNDIANNYGSYDVAPQFFAETLGSTYYRLDDIRKKDNLKVETVDNQRYNDYKFKYIASAGVENSFTSDLVINYFKSFH